jgi:hypothetical protein
MEPEPMILFASLVAFAGVVAGDPAVPPQPAANVSVAADQKICKREIATGSVMPKRTCKTQAEWDAITAASKDSLDKRLNNDRSGGIAGAARSAQ